jgi:2'-5' RNA ligase
MLFFVAHILRGEAGEYHEKITRAISEQFGTEPIHLKLPPHITVVPPFEWDEPRQPVEALRDAVSFAKRGTFYVCKYDHFHTHTIFLSIVASAEMSNAIEQIQKQFRIFRKKENYESKVFEPHASVARFLNCSQFSAIWNFLGEEDPDFQNEFDSVTLFGLRDGVWHIVSEEVFRNGHDVEPERLRKPGPWKPE